MAQPRTLRLQLEASYITSSYLLPDPAIIRDIHDCAYYVHMHRSVTEGIIPVFHFNRTIPSRAVKSGENLFGTFHVWLLSFIPFRGRENECWKKHGKPVVLEAYPFQYTG